MCQLAFPCLMIMTIPYSSLRYLTQQSTLLGNPIVFQLEKLSYKFLRNRGTLVFPLTANVFLPSVDFTLRFIRLFILTDFSVGNYVLTTAKMFTQISNKSGKDIGDANKNNDEAKMEFERKKSIFEDGNQRRKRSRFYKPKSSARKEHEDFTDDIADEDLDAPDEDDEVEEEFEEEDAESSIEFEEMPYLQEYFQDRSSCYQR